MKLLLDTHLLIWSAGLEQDALNRRAPAAYDLINDSENTPVFSVASLWEIIIKAASGRPDFGAEPNVLRRELLDNGWEELPVLSPHALAVASLPVKHKDPFDRLLIAQATVEGMLLLTSDPTVASYPGPVRRV